MKMIFKTWIHNTVTHIRIIIFSLLIFAVFIFNSSTLKIVFAGNPPDPSFSSLAGSSFGSHEVPADGQTAASIIVILADSSGSPLAGDVIRLSAPNDSVAVITPASATLDQSGAAYFSITSTNAGTDNINVTDETSGTTLISLGQVIFDPPQSQGSSSEPSVPTDTPTPSPSCDNLLPGSAPQLISAEQSGLNRVILSWAPASDPVTYYLVAYGMSSGEYRYGNPNIGGHDSTSYTVGSLARNTTYYFVVMAVNGCMPGDFSNELSTTTGEGVISDPFPSVAQTPSPDLYNHNSPRDQNPTSIETILTVTATPPPNFILNPASKSAGGDSVEKVSTQSSNLQSSSSQKPAGSLISGFTAKTVLIIIFIIFFLFILVGSSFYWTFIKRKNDRVFKQPLQKL